MTPQTKRIKEALKEAGYTRKVKVQHTTFKERWVDELGHKKSSTVISDSYAEAHLTQEQVERVRELGRNVQVILVLQQVGLLVAIVR